MNKIESQLDDILAWAKEKLADGKEPPWSWYQFMKLREAIEAIRSGATNIPKEYLPQSAAHPETERQQPVSVVQLDTVRLRRDSTLPQEPK